MICEHCRNNISYQDKECRSCGAPNEPNPKVMIEVATKLKELTVRAYVGQLIEYTGTQRPMIMTPNGVEWL